MQAYVRVVVRAGNSPWIGDCRTGDTVLSINRWSSSNSHLGDLKGEVSEKQSQVHSVSSHCGNRDVAGLHPSGLLSDRSGGVH